MARKGASILPSPENQAWRPVVRVASACLGCSSVRGGHSHERQTPAQPLSRCEAARPESAVRVKMSTVQSEPPSPNMTASSSSIPRMELTRSRNISTIGVLSDAMRTLSSDGRSRIWGIFVFVITFEKYVKLNGFSAMLLEITHGI